MPIEGESSLPFSPSWSKVDADALVTPYGFKQNFLPYSPEFLATKPTAGSGMSSPTLYGPAGQDASTVIPPNPGGIAGQSRLPSTTRFGLLGRMLTVQALIMRFQPCPK